MAFCINLRRRATLAGLAVVFGMTAAVPSIAVAGDLEYGKVGEPINLVVGYQPFYTESWSGIVLRGKKMYEKYLPKGSTVEFSIGLQGAEIGRAHV